MSADPTANAGVGRASRGHRTFHRFCQVDGFENTHGRDGFRCPRCREQADEDDLVGLLLQVERFAGTSR